VFIYLLCQIHGVKVCRLSIILPFSFEWLCQFSTVGYGTTYPALGFQNSNPMNCIVVNLICCLESLSGALFAGFCGAILFGKVLRIQSDAQVIFSDPIVIRFGPGLQHDSYTDVDEDTNAVTTKKLPCPVLEFRIINRLFKEAGGEILDASLSVVANVDENEMKDDATLNESVQESVFHRESQVIRNTANLTNGQTSPASDFMDSTRKQPRSFLASIKLNNDSAKTESSHITVDEDPAASLLNRHIFSRMIMEASDHPFFKRVWHARHVLNEHSPLLSHKIRRQIRKNGGSWPKKLNSAKSIRQCLQFNQILVSLNGVSNVSASAVYAQKI
jgi:hypothetical protein